MIGQYEIMEAIHQEVLEKLPELTYIVEDQMGQNFKRPAWLTEYVTTRRRDANKWLVHVTQHYVVTVFVERDKRGNSYTQDLLELQEKAMDLFLPGYLRVEDRALTIAASSAGRDMDRAYLDIQLEYLDDRSQPEPLPLMEELHTTYTTDKEK